MIKSVEKKLLYKAVSVGLATLFTVSGQTQAADEPAARSLEEIIVTARRREESAQEIPVSLTVMDTDLIFKSGAQDLTELTQLVPGVNITQSGGEVNTLFSIRGMSRATFGPVKPAVATYVDDVPLSIWGAGIPTFDLASVQVLKGPQGTLFGRNTTTGAIVATTNRPEYEFSGYVTATLGNYNARLYEAAVNIPILEDKVALRLAGQLNNRDGYTENMSFPEEDDLDERDVDNFRISLLIEPTDNISNLTTFERLHFDQVTNNTIPVNFDPVNGVVNTVPYYNGQVRTFDPVTFAPIPCNGDPACDISVVGARQEQAGIRKAWSDINQTNRAELTGLTNTTTWDVGPFTIKNIFGFRDTEIEAFTDTDGTEQSQIGSQNLITTTQFSEEIQISGDMLDGNLDYLGGLFYVKSEPDGPNRLALQLFAVSGTPLDSQFPAPFNGGIGTGDYFTEESKAVFGQINYKLGHLSDSLDKFSVDIGLRHTKDDVELCAANASYYGQAPITENECNNGQGITNKTSSSKTTYHLGLNYALTDQAMLYAVTRTGYRSGGTNTPVYGGTLVPFQNFVPEEVQDVELGIKSDWQIGNMIGRFNLAVFHTEVEELQAAIPTAAADPTTGGPDGDFDPSNDPSGTNIFFNVGEATIEGVEVEFAVSPMDGLEILLGGAWLDKEIDKLNDVGLPATLPPDAITQDGVEKFAFLASPDYSYNAGVRYTLPLDEAIGIMTFSADYFKMSEVVYGAIAAPSYDLVDLRLDWEGVMGSSFDVGAWVKNVTDEDVIVSAQNSNEGFGLNSVGYGPPRMYGVTLRYSF